MLPFCAMAQTDGDQFVGNWKVDISKSVESMEGSVKDRYDSLSASMKARASASMADRVFKFKNNEEAHIEWSKGSQKVITKGIWKIEETTSRIAITAEGRTVVYTYSFVSSEAILLKNTSNHGLFNTLYLIKK
jgi:hypothetical protein